MLKLNQLMQNQTLSLRISLCQINPTVGDLQGNSVKILECINKSKKIGTDIIVFPELTITGYPPEDLLLKPKFIKDNLTVLKEISSKCSDICAVIGFVNKNNKDIYNSAAIINNKKIVGIYDKIYLPNYGVFDEKRYFTAGGKKIIFKSGNFTFGIQICEDIWQEKGPAYELARLGADLIIVLNASPYYVEKWKKRESIARKIINNNKSHIAYVNMIGGQDELIFDGHSFVMNNNGYVIKRGRAFEEDIISFDIKHKVQSTKYKEVINSNVKEPRYKIISIPCFSQKDKPAIKKTHIVPLKKNTEVYKALCLGLKDYVNKNGFKSVVFGLSGGIDSALCAAIAADSLGSENVTAIFMPSQYTADQSRQDSFALSKNIGIKCLEIQIEQIYNSYLKELEVYFKDSPANITEENLQARIRSNIIMSFSNKFGHLVIATGNKSETSVGYSTLYGDMAGGLSIIKDVPKTLVYELAEYRNTISPVIPESIIKREPTAELKPNQKDQDTLPPYDILDKIIKEYVENGASLEETIKHGINKKIVQKTIRMIDRNEYKRRQSAPGFKITPLAFGKDRRLPITNKYTV